MIDQNQGSEDGLRAITDHMVGNHTFCNESWCGGLTKRDAYKHLNLPYGKDLTSKELKADLEKIFQNKLLTKANQLSKLSSSQANESFNNTVASKAPKRSHYSGSATISLDNDDRRRNNKRAIPKNIRIEGRTSDIVKIAACSEAKKFNTYVIPNKPMSPEESTITGITVEGNQMFYNKKRCNLTTFSTVIKKIVLSKAMALKAAKSNLKLCHLRTAVNRKGLAGLKSLLSEKTEQGNVRVTSCKKIIKRIFEFLSENKQD
ncbi:unnamed protein product [Mytilus coruscus]|uniref:PML C-terminal domain-containing protein n=1 Tax=Mytilus coruscus TaxID=42192 RepID=A0A6J8AAV0_MYTCO|nr:unnamed protein product [Mytilus coruscus]